MRNLRMSIGLLLIVVMFSVGCATNQYSFKVAYAPNRQYRIEMSTETKSEVEIAGKEEVLAELKNKGMQLPLRVDFTQQMTVLLQTQQPQPGGTFPFSLVYEKFDNIIKMNGMERNSSPGLDLAGLKISGTIQNGNVIQVEGIEGGNIDEKSKEILIQFAENLSKNVHYPEKPMKIGDKFTQEIPMTLPVPNLGPLNLRIVSVYELQKVVKNLAYFKVVQEFKVNSSDQKLNLELTGSGGGALVHDLAANISSEFNSNYEIFLTMNHEEIQVKMKANSVSKYKMASQK